MLKAPRTTALIAALLCTTIITPFNAGYAIAFDTPDGDETSSTKSKVKKNKDEESAEEIELDAEIDSFPAHNFSATIATQSSTLATLATSSSNLIYGASFIARFPNAVSALDIVRRIPGSGPILQRGENSSSRGFGSNDDGVLINGKRISGKQNNSQDALGRIKKDNIDYIEIIRGASPDVKVSSQEAMVNVVLKDGEAGGSGSIEVNTRLAEDGRVNPGGLLSYSGKSGQLEYFAEAKVRSYVTKITQEDRVYDGSLAPASLQNEVGDQNWRGIDLSSNLTYNLNNGDQVRMNGLFRTARMKRPWNGEMFDADGNGGFIDAGESIRYQNNKVPSEWELGGDYGTQLSDTIGFKIIGLHAESKRRIQQSEDFLIDTPEPEVDFLFQLNRKSSESVGRVSFDWDMGGGKSLELGDEIAFNKVSSKLDFQELIPGQGLVSQDIAGSDVTVKETRSESFANYSMKLNDKMNLDASMKFEYSKISQMGVGVDTSKTLEYWKPSVDYRYNITKDDQFQISYRREVSQLNFGDFASSASQDDEVIAGNTDLEPEKIWKLETSYEHRFPNDSGRIKASFSYDRISDVLQRIEITPGVSGVGNAGKANRFTYGLSGSLRMGFIGIPDMVLDAKVAYVDSKINDPFTGLSRQLNDTTDWVYSAELRHDMNDIGLSWSVWWRHDGKKEFYDIDEIIRQPQGQDWLDAYIEYQVMQGTTLKVGVENILNPDAGRRRELYDAGVVGGQITGLETRELRWGRRLFLSLKSVF